MNMKVFGFLVILLIICVIPVADAQISIGQKADQRSIQVVINSVGEVHVKHVVASSHTPRQVDLIDGTVSDLSVTNEQGEEKQFSVIGDNIGVLLLPSKGDSIVEYSLEDALSQKDNVWTWSFRYIEDISFILPEEVDLLFVNENPVYLAVKKGISCHGCEIVLEYSINEPKIFKNVKWEDKEFVVEIRSHSNIDKFIFDQPAKSITFNISEENKFVTTIIPLELLWKPYLVFLDEEKIPYSVFNNDGTHIWLSMKPETSGEITIIGTTVIPEFPIIAPLAVGFLMILVVPLMKKFNLR